MNTESKSMLAKKFAVAFGIAILLPMTIHYGVSTFVPEPKWEDYQVDYRALHSESADERLKAQQEEEVIMNKRRATEKYFQKHLFYVITPIGILAIIFGALIAIQAVGSGLMFGGIFCVMDGYFNYWSELPDAMRFGSLLLALAVLLIIGFKKLNEAN